MAPQITAREYKLMLNHRWFQDASSAVDSFWEEVSKLADSLGFGTKGQLTLNKKTSRTVVFLDTVDFSLHRAGYVLRQRIDGDDVELTLKSMSPDPYIASASNVDAAVNLKSSFKFEEDIGAPWRSRFSISTTVELSKSDALSESDATLADAAKIFPTLAAVTRDRVRLHPELRLQPVNALHAYETLYEDAKLVFIDGPIEQKSSAALILWASSKKGRPLVAEFSFRIKRSDNGFQPVHCRQAKEFFEALQIMDWHLPSGLTKTQYAYRNRHAQES